MRILVASPYPERIKDAFRYGDDHVLDINSPGWLEGGEYPFVDMPSSWRRDLDWIVCYGYRQIIKPEIIARYPGRIINIHISYLPWNRGADPNFWSWVDDTPKGISIHQIDEGIDTGPVYSQLNVDFWNDNHTLRTTYDRLRHKAEQHFIEVWPDIRDNFYIPMKPSGVGSYHKLADKNELFAKLPLGWDTKVKEVRQLGIAEEVMCDDNRLLAKLTKL